MLSPVAQELKTSMAALVEELEKMGLPCKKKEFKVI